jgi:Family of unknown function (DUF6091)
MNHKLYAHRALLALALSLGTALAQAALPTLCVWDPVGRGGKLFGVARSYSWAMEAKGFKIDLKAYSDEGVVVEDFKVGQCDALVATSMRTRAWVSMPTALDYSGAATIVKDGKVDIEASYQVIGQALRALATPQADRLVIEGNREVAGIIPIGATYLMVRERDMLKRRLAGTRMPAFDNDKLQLYLIAKAGGVPVAANSRTFGTMFNNGNLDVVFAPALAYQAMELHKGIGTRGGVSRFPVTFTSLQIVINRNKFPQGFGRASRQYWAEQFKLMTIAARKAEAAIPPAQWIDFEDQEGASFVAMQRESRLEAGKAGHFNKVGLSFMKRVRCQVYPDATECANQNELTW